MAKMDWTVSQERVVLREAREKPGVMARAAHRVSVETKELRAFEAAKGNVERMAKTGLLETGVSKLQLLHFSLELLPEFRPEFRHLVNLCVGYRLG